jgi:dephospho-CoA kinase
MGRGKTIIAFAGRNGCGKETAAKRVAEALKAPHHTYSDILVETFQLWNVHPSSRPQQQALSEFMRKLLGQDAMARVIDKKCAEAVTADVVIDGVRRLTDMESLRRDYGDGFILIWIETAPEIRYRRLKARKEKKGETMMSWEDFLKQETHETEEQLPDIQAAAKYAFNNDGPIEELYRQVDGLLQDLAPVAHG